MLQRALGALRSRLGCSGEALTTSRLAGRWGDPVLEPMLIGEPGGGGTSSEVLLSALCSVTLPQQILTWNSGHSSSGSSLTS